MLKLLAASALLAATFALPTAAAASTPSSATAVRNRPTPTLHIECYAEPLIGAWHCYRFNEDGSLHSNWWRDF